jgi:nitrogen fixation NifU-like protein
MFSEQVLDHFRNPRNAGDLEEATASVEVSNPVCGDILRLAVLTRQGTITKVRFLCKGCTTSIACASKLTELLSGAPVDALGRMSSEALASSFGGLPPETVHGAYLAADAARALLAKLGR